MKNPIKKAYKSTLKSAKQTNRADRKELKSRQKATEKDIKAVGKTRMKGVKLEKSGKNVQAKAGMKMSSKIGSYSAKPRRMAALRQRGETGAVRVDTGRDMQQNPREYMKGKKAVRYNERTTTTPEGKKVGPSHGRKKRLYGKK